MQFAAVGMATSSQQREEERLRHERERVDSVEQEWLAAGEEPWQELEGQAEGGLRVFSSQELADRYNARVLTTLPGKSISLSATVRARGKAQGHCGIIIRKFDDLILLAISGDSSVRLTWAK